MTDTGCSGFWCIIVGHKYILVVYTGGELMYMQEECERCGKVREGDEFK